ncbi:MAG: hypothetical protein FWD27_01830 [Coriobacteriia bacterium]|nr:hypothetical protein [Coriobacteriia bacterium]
MRQDKGRYEDLTPESKSSKIIKKYRHQLSDTGGDTFDISRKSVSARGA